MEGSSLPISMFVVEYLEPPNDDSTDDAHSQRRPGDIAYASSTWRPRS
jgi:hypothetical protein